jgi:hypothetical protein
VDVSSIRGRPRASNGDGKASPGWTQVGNALIDGSPPLDPFAFRVLVVLLRHADRKGQCWPSIDRIAKLTSISRRKVVSVVASLVGIGLVTSARRGPNATLYTLARSACGALQRRSKKCTPCTDEVHAVHHKKCTPCTRTRPKEQDSLNKRARKANVDEQFRRLVAAYPAGKIGDERQARRAFAVLQLNERPFAELLGALEEQKRSDQWQEQRGRVHPRLPKWLADGRYTRAAPGSGKTSSDRARETRARLAPERNGD